MQTRKQAIRKYRNTRESMGISRLIHSYWKMVAKSFTVWSTKDSRIKQSMIWLCDDRIELTQPTVLMSN